MTEQQKANQIVTFNNQISSLREQINETKAKMKIYVEKRDKLNEKVKNHRKDIRILKSKRNSLNEKVKTLKQQRENARTENRSIIEEIIVRSKRIVELKKKKPRKNRRHLEKEIQDIEWKIQTTPFDMRAEKKLVQDVKQLELQLNIYKKIEKQSKKVVELRNELKAIQGKANVHHQKLIATVQKSQELHAMIIANIGEAKKMKIEADRLHRAYTQVKEQARPLYQKIKEITEKRKKLQDAIRKEDEKQKRNAEKALKKKLESQARDKLERGEELSWNEFQLLADGNSQDP